MAGETQRSGIVGRVWKRALGTSGYRLVRTRPTRRQLAERPRLDHTPIEGQEDLRYRFHQWVYDAPVELMVGRPGYSYGTGGWHPYVATARELLADPTIGYEASVLRRVYENFVPETVAELHFPGEAPAIEALERLPAHAHFEAWLLRQPPFSNPQDAPKRPGGSRLNGPVTKAQGIAAHERLRRRVEGLQQYGYRPDLFANGRVLVIVLRHEDTERYLVVHGQHRVGILAAMGEERLEVAIAPGVPPVIDSRDAEQWPHVRSGLISAQDAVTQLARYFVPDLGGRVRDMADAAPIP